MPTTEIVIPGGPQPAWGADYSTPFKRKPFALYAFAGGLAAGAFRPGDDICRGAAAIKVGDPVIGADGAMLSKANHFLTPFTSAALLAAGGGVGITMMIIAKVAADQNFGGIGNIQGGAPGAGLTPEEIGSTILARAIDTPAIRQAYALPATADRGNRWAMYAGIFSATQIGSLERHRGSVALGAIEDQAAANFTRDAPIGIGAQPYEGGYPGVGRVMAAGLWARPWTKADFDAVYEDAVAWTNTIDAGL